MNGTTPVPVSPVLVDAGGAHTPRTIQASTMDWLRSLSADLAHDVQWMDSVEAWRVDAVPGPWMKLFEWLTDEWRDQKLDDQDINALLDFLAYLGSSNALAVMVRAAGGAEPLDRLIFAALERDEASGNQDALARVTLARVRRLYVRRFFTRVFGEERRAEVINILMQSAEELP